ncbi:HAD family hydrolase [Jannaschia sp. S6380]|uniref:HAD family hydrolase n=1 Tax=Jannaschia sp. S6380 TaxID=2926408 RepID=UPI001FF544F3|nr:HAD family hydrolase [Jannaschia sp. S6380]MCK0166138.1 HAD family hydrolase [Jannaschia sp. S6380]
MIRAILFDKDGTLTDFRATWEAWMPGMIADLARASGQDAHVIARGFGFDLAAGTIRPDGLFVTAPGHVVAARIAELIGWRPRDVSAWLGPRTAEVPQVPVDGLPALMRRLRSAGLTLGVLTNADTAEAAHHLERIGVRDAISRIIGCDSGFGAKPDPRGAADFADALGLRRAEVLMVGDGTTDIAAARGAGLPVIGVLTGTLDAATLSCETDAVLPDVTHLPEWLATRGLAIPAA